MAKLKYPEAIRCAILEEMRQDSRVFVMGQDVELFLFPPEIKREFAKARVRNTPISEAGFIGAGIGAALTGLRPIIELGCSTFLYSAMDQIVNQAAKNRYMFGGQASVPLVIRAPVFYGIAVAAHHSDRPWGMFAQAPGLKVIVPATAYDAKGLLKSAIRDGNPVLCFEDVGLTEQCDEVPDADYTVPIGAARIRRVGSDLTVVSLAASVHTCLGAAEELSSQGISAEVVDLRTVVPLDRATILESVAKTGRLIVVDPAPRMCGVAAEVSALVAEEAFEFLKSPIVRLTAPDVPVPFSSRLEREMFPTTRGIVAAAVGLCGERKWRVPEEAARV